MLRTPRAAHARLRRLATLALAVATVLGPGSVTATAGTVTPAPAEATGDAVGQATAPATVSGRVTDSVGDPVEGAVVAVGSVDPRSDAEEWAVTDADGRYTVPGVPSGIAVAVGVESPLPWMHHQFWPGTADGDEAAALVLAAGEVRTGMDVVLPDAGGLGGVVQVPAGMDEYCVTASGKFLWYDLPVLTGCAAAGEPYLLGPLPAGGYVVEATAFASSGTVRTGTHFWRGPSERWAAEEVAVFDGALRGDVDVDLTGAAVLGSQPVTLTATVREPTPSDGYPFTMDVRVSGTGPAPTGVVETWSATGNTGSGALVGGVAHVGAQGGREPIEVLYTGDAVYAPSRTTIDVAVAPSVRGVEPASGAVAGGTRVSVRGVGLGTATRVTFGDVPGTGLQVVSDDELLVTAPAHAAGSVDLVVTGPLGSSNSMGQQFQFVDAVAVAPTRVVSDLSVPAGAVRCVAVAGQYGVPATARGVTVNVTTVRPSGAGYVVVYPDADGTGRTPPPATSTVNFEQAEDVANGTLVALPSSGRVCYATAGAERAGVLLDVTGWVGAEAGLTLRTPHRLLDTRPGTHHVGAVTGPVEPRRVYTVDVRGKAGVSVGARGVLVNVTVTGATAAGNLRVFPAGQAVPHASVVNYAPGRDKAAGTVVALPESGQIAFYSDTFATSGDSPVHVVIDVLGETSGGSALHPMAPQRILDTREEGRIDGPLVPRRVYAFEVPGEPMLPRDVAALVLNVTAVGPGSVGNLRVYPDADGSSRTPPPWASSINYIPGRTIANQVVVAVPSDRKVVLYSDSSAPVDVVVDVVGYVAAQ